MKKILLLVLSICALPLNGTVLDAKTTNNKKVVVDKTKAKKPTKRDIAQTQKTVNYRDGNPATVTLDPGNTIPDSQYVGNVPDGQQFDHWESPEGYTVGTEITDAMSTINLEPKFVPVAQPNPNPNPNPNPPVTPAPTPVVTQKVNIKSALNNVIIKESEVQDPNITLDTLLTPDIEIVTTTTLNGVVQSTTTAKGVASYSVKKANLKLGANLITIQDKTLNGPNHTKLDVNVLVVANEYTISQDRGIAMKVANPHLTFTQAQAQKQTAETLVQGFNASAINGENKAQKVAILKTAETEAISKGIIGEYQINLGIVVNPVVKSGKVVPNTKAAFLVPVKVSVKADPTTGPIQQLPNASLQGTVSADKLAGQTGNTYVVSKEGNKAIVGVQTAASVDIMPTVIVIIVSAAGLVLIRRTRRV